MTEHLNIGANTVAYDVIGEGSLVVLANGIGDSRHSYRFIAPALAAAGYRIANMDIRGCGDSSLGWDGYSRTDIGSDLVALVHHLGGGPAVIIGQSISGGAATIAAASAPALISGLVELAPFTRAQSYPLGGLLRVKRYRRGAMHLAWTLLMASLPSWKKYLDLAYPTKPSDWDAESARIDAKLSEPGRMKAMQAMFKSDPSDAGAQLKNVRCPVLVIEGSGDPDWADPRAEGNRIMDDLPEGLGELRVLEGPGLVIVQGAFGTVHNYDQLCRALADEFTVYCADRRGRGMSPCVYGPATSSIQREVEDVDALLTESDAT